MSGARVFLSVAEQTAMQGRLRQLHLGQTFLSDILGIQQSTLSAYLNGRSRAPVELLGAMAAVLSMPDLMRQYPEALSPEAIDARQRQVLTRLVDDWVLTLPLATRGRYYQEKARLIEGTPPYGPQPISLVLWAYGSALLQGEGEGAPDAPG